MTPEESAGGGAGLTRSTIAARPRLAVPLKMTTDASRVFTLDVQRTTDHNRIVIQTFGDLGPQRLFDRRFVKRLAHLTEVALRRLVSLDAAKNLSDLRIPPSNRLEALIGNRKGQHSLRINDQYRVCFRWKEGNAYDVEITKHYC
ncbi:MAG: type II toxin-antitoxin system RelE/ParE family toxin [Bryobacteraceae bacterium]